MKIAIHNRENSFSERWIAYCKENDIQYKIVNAFDNDIINKLSDCDIFIWHYHQAQLSDRILAQQLLFSLEHAGIKVFPNFRTMWHFDDKVGQKYLLENLEIPLIPSYVFYEKEAVLSWINTTSFPKIFKLRGGAGSLNVRMIKNKKQATKLVNQAFGKGFQQFDGKVYFLDVFEKYRSGIKNLKDLAKAFGRMLISTEYSKGTGNEKGYLYFQDFAPLNNSDIRVIIIEDKAFAIKRMNRENDFRASGSGQILYGKEHFNDSIIKLAFDINDKLDTQCCAMDFVNLNGEPHLVEISYGFQKQGYDDCVGYWDKDLKFHEGSFNPYGWMIDNLIKNK